MKRDGNIFCTEASLIIEDLKAFPQYILLKEKATKIKTDFLKGQ